MSPQSDDANAIQGIVLLDQAFELAMRVASDVTKRFPEKRYFEYWLRLFPELQDKYNDLIDAHEIRNKAQHVGIVPQSQIRAQIRNDLTHGLRILFRLCGADFDTFSSVPQIRSDILRKSLEAALRLSKIDTVASLSEVFTAFKRLHGWAAEIIGTTTIPEEMWMFDTPLWQDVQWEYTLADKKNEIVRISLSVVAGHVLGINFAALLRLRRLFAKGGSVERRRESGRSSNSYEEKTAPKTDDVIWAIEIVARAVIYLEEEWPDEVLG